MERVLLGVYETDKAIVKIYTGPMTATEEQRREYKRIRAFVFPQFQGDR